ncbi:MAG: single-stranded DNA-binding protein [Candidatus Ancillula trichonymphae]|jgi:single-strand DNA-binding protein|nr:single-stranded DNA-binding protein [Candidatus Ancillula trichonymphae]
MAGETVVTVVGNLTAEPELRFTPSGAQVVSFTIASTARVFDRASGEWRAGDSLFLRCSAWRELAENISETLQKGMRVIVQGRLTQRSYQAQDGSNRTVYELSVDEIGPSLRWASATVNKKSSGGSPQSQSVGARASVPPNTGTTASDDPWANDNFPSDPTDLPF